MNTQSVNNGFGSKVIGHRRLAMTIVTWKLALMLMLACGGVGIVALHVPASPHLVFVLS